MGRRRPATIGLLLVAIAVVLVIENYSLLIGEAASRGVEAKIRRVVEEDETVVHVVALHTTHVGPHDVLIVIAVEFRDGLAISDVERAVERLHRRITEVTGTVTNPQKIVIEPARRRAAGDGRRASDVAA